MKEINPALVELAQNMHNNSTPRTDKLYASFPKGLPGDCIGRLLDHARTLERELQQMHTELRETKAAAFRASLLAANHSQGETP